MNPPEPAFWSLSASQQLDRLQASAQGLSSGEAQRRLAEMGGNLSKPKGRLIPFRLLFNQFTRPMIL